MSDFFKLQNRDFNASWSSKRDLVMLDEDEVILQAITNVLFIDENELYYGIGNELAIPQQVFEFISDVGDSLALQEIQFKLSKLDSRLQLDSNLSSVTPYGDEFQIHLVIAVENRNLVLDRRIQVA